jgi:hypothetical protein
VKPKWATYKTEPRWYDKIRYDFTFGATDKSLKVKKEEIAAAYFAALRENIRRADAVRPKGQVH